MCNLKIFLSRSFVLIIVSFISIPSFAFEPGEPFRVSHAIQANEDISSDFKISPDGKILVYRAPNRDSGTFGLYSVQLSGREISNLTVSTPDQIGEVLNFQISPDNTKVVYVLDTPEGHNLRFVNINGGLSRGISKVAGNSFNEVISRYLISWDSSKVVYLTDEDETGDYQLYRSSLTEPVSTGLRVGPELQPGRSIESDIKFVPDQNAVVYRANLNSADKVELYWTQINTALAPVKLNDQPVTGGNVERPTGALAGSDAFSISLDGKYVVYHADQRRNNSFELYSVTLAFPLMRNTLNPLLIDAASNVFDHQISPDGKRVLYRADERVIEIKQLFSVPIDGIALPVLVSNDEGVDDSIFEYKFSPNSQRVAYTADHNASGELRLYSTSSFIVGSLSGFAPLTPDIVDGGDVMTFNFDKNGAKVVYSARQDRSTVNELYSVRIDGSDSLKLHAPLIPGSNVLGSSVFVDPVRNYVFYRADQDKTNVLEVFGSPVNGPENANLKLNKSLPEFSPQDVTDFVLSSDSRYLVYRADQDVDKKFELYASSLEGESDACIPIKAANGNLAVVCL